MKPRKLTDLDRLVRTGDVARAIGVSVRTIYTWCDEGRLKSRIFPGHKHFRIKIRDAMDFAKDHQLPFDPFKL